MGDTFILFRINGYVGKVLSFCVFLLDYPND